MCSSHKTQHDRTQEVISAYKNISHAICIELLIYFFLHIGFLSKIIPNNMLIFERRYIKNKIKMRSRSDRK
jgi:hypothetical protein